MLKIPNSFIHYIVDKYQLNSETLTPSILREGIRIELEHRDIIGDDLESAFRIALAHWMETDSRYYKKLKKMEREMKQNPIHEDLFE